ncbi:MAG: rhodanese-like domain-containing protein [Desulfofustis sp.]|nr:rhodanese-like domain-containing protein [Desulfofustis sp.]
MNRQDYQSEHDGAAGEASSRRQLLSAAWQATLLLVCAALIGIVTNIVRGDGIPLIGDWSAGGASANQQDGLVIALEQAKERFEKDTALFIDARSAVEYQDGHIAGALSLPLDEAENRSIDLIDRLYDKKMVITYCDGESCNLSHELAVFLQDMGVEQVRVLFNGWTVWREAGLPVGQGDG